MSPSSSRWRPRRAGIINLYEYANQVFDFSGGRLLLRGHNTSGKTKALELLLPFCLDGDISPKKLDPFGAGYKDMKWNLIGCTGDLKRVGYAWLEFERIGEPGTAQRLTVGVGMRYAKEQPEVTRWYFVARNRSVGSDLSLMQGRDPISRAELAAALGDDGEVLDTGRDYRGRLNDLMFGFGGEEQYQTMLRLMRDLRRPHLSKTLDPDRVAAQLAIGLPEVDEALMRKLAGGLEQLETLERGLARLRDVRERVRRFHQRTYSAYARAAVRERADALRQANTAVEGAAERLRAAAADLADERQRAQRATEQRDAAQARLDALSAEEHALVTSAAWSSVAEVETLRELAQTQARAATAARGHADDAAATAGALEAELITARAAAAERRTQASDELDSLLALAADAGLERRAATLADQLRTGALAADTWSPLLRGLATDWRDVLHRHRELIRELRRAAGDAERARADERGASARLEQAAARRAACEQQLEETRAALRTAFEHWRTALEQLELDEAAAAAALELAHEGSSPLPALAPSVDRRRASLSDERSTHAAAREAAAAAVAASEEEIDRLAAAHDDGPRAPEWRRADRIERAGAPLWRLIDFRAEVPADERSSLEAGLEAAGLLDAWVTPSGDVEDPALADVVFAGAAPADGRTLLEVLEPVADQPVAVEVVARLLSGLGLGERETGPWAGVDGSFALGPLRGRGAKDQAEHIGAAARESRRAVRIAQLRDRIAALESEIAEHEARIADVDRRRQALDAELQALPPVDAIRSALDAVRVSSALEAEAERGYERAAGAARSAADAELAAAATRREHAVAHGLSPALDEPALDVLRDATAQLTGACGAVAHAWTIAEREAQAADAVAARLSQAQQTASEHAQRARDEEAEATRLAAEHAARERALGATGVELRRRHEQVVTELKATRDEFRHTSEAAQAAAVAVVGLEHDERARHEEHETARERRERASVAFRQLAQAGILQLVLRDDAPSDSDQASGWTFTRTLEVVRALPPELLAVRSTAGELGVEVQRGVQLLDRELAEADMGAYASRGEDDLLLVHVTEGGGEQTLGQILNTLEAEIADREQILTAEERRVFSDALVEEIADHLRYRIHEVRGRIERMNAVLRRSPTAAGKTVELEWEALEDDAGTQRAALARLRRDVRHLGEGDRAELVAFFRGRIESARREHTFGGEPKPMAETLMDAFDYRTWFAFTLHERIGSSRVRLTKRRHAVGSGGEQSVLIHLPLFAAAAALYGDSEAPRLIMLDEALSGIDDETRERVLEATVAFDLDVVMTSHELWGTYRSVPQLSIYQLHRENGTFGVHAIPFLWDGEVLRELEQDELLV
jgi:uncharacterized protein (TIGR02680 family)